MIGLPHLSPNGQLQAGAHSVCEDVGEKVPAWAESQLGLIGTSRRMLNTVLALCCWAGAYR